MDINRDIKYSRISTSISRIYYLYKSYISQNIMRKGGDNKNSLLEEKKNRINYQRSVFYSLENINKRLYYETAVY